MSTAKKAALILGILLLIAFLISLAPPAQRDRLTLTLVAFSTNQAGHRTVTAKLHHAAVACKFEPRLLIVTDEEYATSPPSARVPMTSYTENGKVVYYSAKTLTPTNTAIQSSTGLDLQRGQSTTLTFVVPENQGWCLSIDCSRTPTPPTIADKLAQLNGWANQKFGAPHLFSTRSWSAFQATSPVIPPKVLENGQIPDHVKSSVFSNGS